jgi:chromosomal replication initiation ATPase DnaA
MEEKIKRIIWISGKCGYGKTELANSIIRDLGIEGKETGKISGRDFLDLLIKNIETRIPIKDTVSQFQNYDLLVIDDIDYIVMGRPKAQQYVKEVINKIIDNNKTEIILISQKRARKARRLKFNSDRCSYVRLKTPSTELKKSLIKSWSREEGFVIPKKKTEELVNNLDNLFQLKGLFNKIKFSRRVKAS